MVDEVGHIAYCRALGRPGLAMARALVSSVAGSILSDQREFALLVGRERFTEALAAFDPALIAADCHAAPFWLNASATAFAT